MHVNPEYAEYKPEFSKLHSITSRQFNAQRMSIEGRLKARKASLEQEHDKVAAKLAGATKVIERIEEERKSGTKTKQNAFVLHQKKRLKAKPATKDQGSGRGHRGWRQEALLRRP